MRVLKSLRAIRMARSLRFLRGLRLLVKACQCFLPSLCWSMVLLGLMMTIGALLLGNLLSTFVLDPTLNEADRRWLWERYGTAYRASYTLFEITFAGSWPTLTRPVMSKASDAFVIFFVFYITVVVFAVIRVIGAVFLKDTLDAAQNDAEQLVIDRLQKKQQFVKKLEGIFNSIDEGKDGLITEERLSAILEIPQVEAYFQTMDLDVREGRALFHLIDNGDGEVTLDEFIDGIMRCKGPARAIDQVALHSDVRQLDAKVAKILDWITHQERENLEKA
ncbi:Ankyrin repeat domain-containing protein 17 [Durusdinium trenchii]|uniref:Ankyrin repeat domain-containing protein 17 n=1 Tax=Durusdinium trenchii TaxID=1381693 RepID=A0ABP0Q9X2_9DINO